MGEIMMRCKKGLVGFACIAAGLGMMSAAFGQVQEEWVRRYNGPGNSVDRANALVVDSGGNVYVTGSSRGSGTGDDYATLKYDKDGNLLWERRYNGPGNSGDGATALAVDSEGNVYVIGSSRGSGTRDDYATLKYDTNGNQLWARRYNGPGNGRDRARALAVDSAGNVYVTGTSLGSGTYQDYATLKYDTDGNLLWEMRYSGPVNSSEQARALAVDSADNVYVTGYSPGSGTRADYVTIKYSQPLQVLPESFNVVFGSLVSGGLSDLLESDDSYLIVQEAPAFPVTLPSIRVEVQGTYTGSASQLTFKMELSCTATPPIVVQELEMYNYAASSWDIVFTGTATPADSVISHTPATPSDYIDAGTGEMKSRISLFDPGTLFSPGWRLKIDQALWSIVP